MMMMMDEKTDIITAIEIPVIFYDGEKEIDLGKVQITPSMTFKLLQSTLSNKIGISPNHITIYFDRNNNYNNNNNNYHVNHHHHRRRHPVTSKFDFSAVEAVGCFFWVVLKRGRRNRRRRNGKNDIVEGGQFVLLRRGVNDNDWEYLEYVNRLRMIDQIEREKERYLMSLNLNSNVYNELSGYGFNVNDYNNYGFNNSSNYSDDYYYGGVSMSSGDDFDVDHVSCSSSTGGASSERVFCDVCYNFSPGSDTVPFHWCKNDVVVTTATRSLVGPIAPPSKNSLHG